MDAKHLHVVKGWLRTAEGVIPWIYRDSAKAGNATCGIGHLVPDLLAAQCLPFSPSITASEWAALMALPAGMSAIHYSAATEGRLAPEHIEGILNADMDDVLAQLRRRLPAYDTYPSGPQAALLDMCFNLGESGLMDKFPHLISSVRAGDWATAAEHCHRRGIAEGRNAQAKAWFLESVPVPARV